MTVNDNGQVVLGSKIEATSVTNSGGHSFYNTDEKLDAGQHIIPSFDNQDFNLTDPMPLIGLNFQYYQVKFGNRHVRLVHSQLRTDNFADVFQ